MLLDLRAGCTALVLVIVGSSLQAGRLVPPLEHVPLQERAIQAQATKPAAPSTPDVGLDTPLSEEELAWARAAWAYFAGPLPAKIPLTPTPLPEGPVLVPLQAGSPFATPWSMGDQVAATVLAHRLGLIEDREFDQRFSRLVAALNTMPLAFGEMPNRFYSIETGAMLGPDLQEGVAGWSAVDTGRLLVWLRIAAAEYPRFEPFIRNAVSRLSVCQALSAAGRLQLAQPGEAGVVYGPETARGYDAYSVQGFRAWGLEAALPVPAPASFEIEIDGARFELAEDVANQAPVLTTAPAYLGLELAFDPIGTEDGEAVAGGHPAEELMTLVHDLQGRRFADGGTASARADFRRSEEPSTVVGAILANGYAWTTVQPEGAARPDLDLISTRAAFGLDAFFDGDLVDALGLLTRELHDPDLGWYEGRYERTGGYETTRTSATNAFVLEAIAHRHLGPLYPDAARPDGLQAAIAEGGACRLPLAASEAP